MMEKPLAVSSADAHAIAKIATDAHIKVLVNYFIVWDPSNHAVVEAVRAGKIGDVRKIGVQSGHRGPKEIGVGPEFLGWLTDPKLNGGGALYDFGCYGVDLATWVMKNEAPLTVTAITQQIKPDVYPKVDDEATIILTYPKTQAIIQASWNWAVGRQDFQVYGNKGYVETAGNDKIEMRGLSDKQAVTETAAKLTPPTNDEFSYLRAVILENAPVEPLTSLEANVLVADIMDAARQSATTGKTVKFEKH